MADGVAIARYKQLSQNKVLVETAVLSEKVRMEKILWEEN